MQFLSLINNFRVVYNYLSFPFNSIKVYMYIYMLPFPYSIDLLNTGISREYSTNGMNIASANT